MMVSEMPRGKPWDLTDQDFGKLHVNEIAFKDEYGHVHWLCTCSCGNKCTVVAQSLTSGATESCGCANEFDTLESKRRAGLLSSQVKKDHRCSVCNKYAQYIVIPLVVNREYQGPFVPFCAPCAEKTLNLPLGRVRRLPPIRGTQSDK